MSSKRVEARYWGVDTVGEPSRGEKLLGRFEVLNGQNRLERNPSVGGGSISAGAVKDNGD